MIFSPKTVKIKSLMIMHLRWLTKTWQTSKQSSLAIDHQHESHLSLLLLIDHKIARCRPTRKPRCVPPFLKVDWSGTLFVHQTLLIWRSFYLTDRLFVWYRSVHPSPFALRGVVGSPQPDALSTRPTRAADHDDDIHCGITLVNAMMMTLTRWYYSL